MTAQNKETYLESMNEEYKQKHYPEGPVFKAHKRATKGAGTDLSLFFMGAFLANGIAGLVWSINKTLEITRDKEENMLGVGVGISVFFLLLMTVLRVTVFFVTKDIRKTVDDWIRVAAKTDGLEEQGIREFNRQATGLDSLILNHLGKLKSFTTEQKREILTRDYVCLYDDNMSCVLKLSRLMRAYTGDNIYHMKVGETRKQAHYLIIHLMTEDKRTAWAETSREAARALQEELESRYPGIDTTGGSVLPG